MRATGGPHVEALMKTLLVALMVALVGCEFGGYPEPTLTTFDMGSAPADPGAQPDKEGLMLTRTAIFTTCMAAGCLVAPARGILPDADEPADVSTDGQTDSGVEGTGTPDNPNPGDDTPVAGPRLTPICKSVDEQGNLLGFYDGPCGGEDSPTFFGYHDRDLDIACQFQRWEFDVEPGTPAHFVPDDRCLPVWVVPESGTGLVTAAGIGGVFGSMTPCTQGNPVPSFTLLGASVLTAIGPARYGYDRIHDAWWPLLPTKTEDYTRADGQGYLYTVEPQEACKAGDLPFVDGCIEGQPDCTTITVIPVGDPVPLDTFATAADK